MRKLPFPPKSIFPVSTQSSGIKSSQDVSPQMTRKPNTQSRVPPMCLSGQPALELLLAACRKQDGGEWAWVVNVASTAAAVG